MPNMVGLGPVQDPLDETGKQELRGSMPLKDGSETIQPVALRPVATPVDKYARPAPPPINSNYDSLIQGLSQLNSALTGYKNATASQTKKPDKDAVINAINGKTPEEIHEMVNQPEKYPVFASQLNQQFAGEKLARIQADNQFQKFQQWWTVNGNANMDPTAEWDKMVQRDIATFGPNKGFSSAYFDQSQSYRNQIAGGYLNTLKQQTDYQQAAETQGGFAALVRKQVNDNADPNQTVEQAATYFQLNKNISRLPYSEQVKQIKGAFQPLMNDMDQRPELAGQYATQMLAILQTPRKGEDGVPRRLIDAPNGLGEVYQGIAADIEKKRDEIYKNTTTSDLAHMEFLAKHDPASLTEKQIDDYNESRHNFIPAGTITALKKARYEALQAQADKQAVNTAQQMSENDKTDILSRNVQTIQDGKMFVPKVEQIKQPNYFLKGDHTALSPYSPEQQKQDAVEQIGKSLDFQQSQLVNTGKLTKEQAQVWRNQTELETFSRAGIYPKEWKDEADAGLNQLTTNAQMASKEMPEGTMQAYQRWKQINAGAPNLVGQIYDSRARTIFEAADSMPGSDRDKLSAAAMYYANRSDEKDALARKKVVEEVERQTGVTGMAPQWLRRAFGSDVPENVGQITNVVQQQAAYLMQAYHIDAKTAIAKATENAAKHFTVVNGYGIDTNDQRIPQNFKTIAENYIRNVVEAAGGPKAVGVDDYRDITLQPFTDGSFVLFNKKTLTTLPNSVTIADANGNNFDGRILRPEMLAGLADQERQKTILRATRAQNEAQETRQKIDAIQKPIENEVKANQAKAAEQAGQVFNAVKAATHNPFKPAIINRNSRRGAEIQQ
jgi:hypothetical protein